MPPADLPPDTDAGTADVRVRLDGPVATVTLDNPGKRNAQTPGTWRALRAAGSTLPAEVRVVVLRGTGSSFSAGLDRAMFGAGVPGEGSFADLAGLGDADADTLIAGYQEAFTWWRRPGLVSVAAVQGHAIGAGFQLALACDLRILAADAQLAMAETTLGLVPDLGGTGLLVDLVGYPRALEICATGRRVGAEEALRLGLCELVVAVDDLDGAVEDLVAALLAAPADALAATKALLAGARGRDRAAQLAAERSAQVARIRALAGAG